MIWDFKLLFYRLSYTIDMELFLANVDNDFNVAVVFSLMTNFPFHTVTLHLVIPESTKRNQSSLKPITVYCQEQAASMICICRSSEKDRNFVRHDE